MNGEKIAGKRFSEKNLFKINFLHTLNKSILDANLTNIRAFWRLTLDDCVVTQTQLGKLLTSLPTWRYDVVVAYCPAD